MFFKLVLIFVIMTIQNSNSKTVEIPDGCKGIECIRDLFRGQLKKETTSFTSFTTPSGKMELLLNA